MKQLSFFHNNHGITHALQRLIDTGYLKNIFLRSPFGTNGVVFPFFHDINTYKRTFYLYYEWPFYVFMIQVNIRNLNFLLLNVIATAKESITAIKSPTFTTTICF